MAITNRQTPHRPGPHPHRSVFTSFEPHAIIMHHIRITPLVNGYFDHPYSPTAECMYRNMLIDRRSESCEVTGGASERRYVENIGAPSSSSGYITKSKPYYTGDTLRFDRTVGWSPSADDQPEEDAVMQISGAGHWFLEGWIGDYAVDFLVNLGSAVTASEGECSSVRHD